MSDDGIHPALQYCSEPQVICQWEMLRVSQKVLHCVDGSRIEDGSSVTGMDRKPSWDDSMHGYSTGIVAEGSGFDPWHVCHLLLLFFKNIDFLCHAGFVP